MRNTYRYRVILEKGTFTTFLHIDTPEAGHAVQIACMLQAAQGRQIEPSLWRGITHDDTQSITADSITMERIMIAGDMAAMMAEDASRAGGGA